jgi:hypothetical protein
MRRVVHVVPCPTSSCQCFDYGLDPDSIGSADSIRESKLPPPYKKGKMMKFYVQRVLTSMTVFDKLSKKFIHILSKYPNSDTVNSDTKHWFLLKN